ncbi:AIR synthase related protein [Marinitoga lauensis]|uniref:AIR synthase related protein n=1 Tax=Marinitoga lauensis TaxID=2201189 RepID=UPI00101260D9|nr:AIR synthase related protein [Marinitoga lauensis]
MTIINVCDNKELAIACDSSGGIGNKQMDIIKVPPDIVGYFTAHVALAEIISYGAFPIAVIDTLSVELNDTGKEIIKGIKKALEQLGINENKIITGSTEENFPVVQTGMGITVIGEKRNLLIIKLKKMI